MLAYNMFYHILSLGWNGSDCVSGQGYPGTGCTYTYCYNVVVRETEDGSLIGSLLMGMGENPSLTRARD